MWVMGKEKAIQWKNDHAISKLRFNNIVFSAS